MDAVRQVHTNHGRSSPFKASQVDSSHELDQRLRSLHLAAARCWQYDYQTAEQALWLPHAAPSC